MSEKFPDMGVPRREAVAGSISIDQFIALNEELAALVRAGLPLERSLGELGRDIPGQLGETMQLLATRMGGGESLPQALAAERHRFPGIYRAVVEAGLKAGRLSAALDGLAGFARTYAEIRRAIGMALVYPLIVLTFAYGLLVFFVLHIAPRFLSAYSFFRLPADKVHDLLANLRVTLPYWGPVVPALLFLFGVWWIQSARVALLQPTWTRRMLGRLPWVRGILANSRSACFAELLSLLVEQEVPLHESITLAADATGDEAMANAAKEIAAGLEKGDAVAVRVREATVFPPMLRWLIVTGLQRGALAKSLRHAARTYRELALHQSSLVKQLLPAVLLLAIGASAGLIYALSVFVPFTTLLNDLSGF